MLAGGRTCVDMEDYGCACEAWLREFMALENGILSHDTSRGCSSCWPRPACKKTLLGPAQNSADRLRGVVAVDGKVLRQSFEKASLLPAQRAAGRRALRADRPRPLGDRERRCSHRTVSTGCSTCRWTKTARATARATARPAWRSSGGWLKNIARMHPDKRSVRRKFLNAMWRNDFLLDMIRYIRNHE